MNKRHYEHTLPNIRGSLSNTYEKRKGSIKSKPVKGIASSADGYQLSFFQLDDPVLSQVRDEIKNLDVNNLTPLEALNKLSEIRRIITGK